MVQDEANVAAMDITQLKAELQSRGVDYSACLEKHELAALLLQSALGPAAQQVGACAQSDVHVLRLMCMEPILPVSFWRIML